jgi:hypothetical protein
MTVQVKAVVNANQSALTNLKRTTLCYLVDDSRRKLNERTTEGCHSECSSLSPCMMFEFLRVGALDEDKPTSRSMISIPLQHGGLRYSSFPKSMAIEIHNN